MSSSLSNVLKSLIVRAGFSEHELSRKTGVKQPIIHRLLSGENINPKLDTLKPIAQYFAISISQLIGEETLFDQNSGNATQTLSNWKPVPLLEKEQWGSNSCDQKNTIQWIMIDCSVSEKAFVIQWHDTHLPFPLSENCLVIIDPLQSPAHQDFVLVKDKHTWLIKYYVKKNNKSYLFASSAEPDTIEVLAAENNILGTVIRIIYNRTEHS